MFLSKFNTNGISNLQEVINELINEWEGRYMPLLENLCKQYNINAKASESSNDSDDESNADAYKLIREAINCKAFIEVEYKAIQDIRSELEDCQMVKELSESLQQIGKEKDYQSKEIDKLNEKNWRLQQEKERLEKYLCDKNFATPLNNNEQSNKKLLLAEKLENLRNRAQTIKNMNQNSSYCHIAPSMNIFSDSEHSITEEDSLEKDKKIEINKNKENMMSPTQFSSGLLGVSKSTPIKVVSDNQNSRQTKPNGNLTQDLKDIHTYLNDNHEESYINNTSIIDWDMSQPSLDDFREKNGITDIFKGINDQDNLNILFNSRFEDKVPSTLEQSAVCSSQTCIHQIDSDTKKLKSELTLEKEKHNILLNHITKLYESVNPTVKNQIKQNPTCSGDQSDIENKDPVEQICHIQRILENKEKLIPTMKGESKSFRSRFINIFTNKNLKTPKTLVSTNEPLCHEVFKILNDKKMASKTGKKKSFSDSQLKSSLNSNTNSSLINKRNNNKLVINQLKYKTIAAEFEQKNIVITQEPNKSQIEEDQESLNIFKSLSEASVRLLTEIVNNLYNVDLILSRKNMETNVVDNTSQVMDYLQYLVSLKNIDFSNEDTKCHPIYDLIKNFERNATDVMDRLISSEKEKSGLSEALELFYQEQLNKCYDDISRLKRQLESSQQLLANKMPIDTAEDEKSQLILIEDLVTYIHDNFTLFEAKQKLQEELENVDREYSRQMIRERKRFEDSEIQYNELLIDYENMQKKYSEEVTSLKLSIDQLQRQHDDDKRFIDQQHFEWDLERSQHNIDIDNLNKTIGRIKRSSSCSESLSECGESPIKSNLKKSNSLPKSKYQQIRLSNNEFSLINGSTQTVNQNIIVLAKQVSITDLENHEGFTTLLKDLKEKDKILLVIVHELSEIIFDVVENERLAIHMPNLLDLSEKDVENLPGYCDVFWDATKSEIWKLKEFLINFLKEGRSIMLNYERILEELESSKTNLIIKQDQVNALEEEVQSLIDFQRNLSKDYEMVQLMLEEKQIALDELSNNILAGHSAEMYEEKIKILKKELEDKQNIIDERDEDLYVLKEEKENINQERLQIERQYNINLDNNKAMYQDLENELKNYQRNNQELHQQIDQLIIQTEDRAKEIDNKENLELSLRTKIFELTQDNEILEQKFTSIVDENNLSKLRLIELEQQHKNNLEKLTKNLEESERINRELMNSKITKIENFSNSSCQTDLVPNEMNSHECHINCIDTQKNLISTINNLKKENIAEKDKRDEIETKHRQFVAQYDALSNKVFSLENSVKNPKLHLLSDHDNLNESVESFDRNTFRHASQISLQSFEEDVDLNLNEEIMFEKFKSVACQTFSDIQIFQNDMNLISMENNCGINISDWLADLLNEVENVLQSCVIGEDISAEVLSKVSKFRQLLEHMYKRQLSTLLDKISSIERELQIERKTNLELNNKSNFLMTEVQESESVQRNLKSRLDQILSENSRITESYRVLSDKARSTKINLTDQMNQMKDELESEKFQFNDINRQFKNEQRRREQLDVALSVANERTNLFEESNSEMLKKSRQQMDYQQKEIDNLNSEYAEMFRRCNENKLQLETLQQNLHFQTMEAEKAKQELRETIQSNTEYRTKMNEFIKIYQGKRSKLEIETKELHQLLQISCRREITFIKENESLRLKCQSVQSLNKENERKLKELENCIGDLHQRHEEDRHEWLKMINGSIDNKKDESVLSQVNWLLRMLQLRIELLGLHYVPNSNYGPVCTGNNRSECGNTELVMLLSSIKSMQSMISVYLNNTQDVPALNCGHSLQNKTLFSVRSDKQQSTLSKRPKPTGSSDSLDSLSDTESGSVHLYQNDAPNNMSSVDTKVYILQMNKIVELQIELNHSEKRRQCLLYQNRLILSQIPSKLRSLILKPLLSEEQKMYIKENFFKFKFKAIVIVIMALRRFSKPVRQMNGDVNMKNHLLQAASNVPFPKFSTVVNNKSIDTFTPNASDDTFSFKKTSKIALPTRNNIGGNWNQPIESNGRRPKCSDELSSGRKTLHQNDGANNQSCKKEIVSNPTHCVSPILERPFNQQRFIQTFSNTKVETNKNYTTSPKQGLSNSYSYPLRSALKSTLNQNNVVSSLDRNILGKTVKLSNTIRQIDDFGKRLDKYSSQTSGP